MGTEFKSLTISEKNDLYEKLNEVKQKVTSDNFLKLEQTLEILSKLNLDYSSFFRVITLFELENNLITSDTLKNYSKSTAYVVEAAHKLEQFNFASFNDEAENIHKVFFSMAKDLTVVFLVLAKILIKIKHIHELDKTKADLLIKYATEIYAPLASRLGLSDIKGEMEDLILKYSQPDVYLELENLTKEYWSKALLALKELKIILTKTLNNLGIEGEIHYRQKHISSVHKKIQNKNITIAEIYDFAALRIVVKTVDECYAVLGKVHSLYKPMPCRFKDYIANPKENGYQSLHTTIIYTNEKPVEIQIRTEEMHKSNEFGVSAHWRYKEKIIKMSVLDNKMAWVRDIMDSHKNSSALDFVEALKVNLYDGKVLVQTPKGKVVELPENSIVVDFAYAIHSDLGNKCIGAKVNGKFVPISTVLSNNDQVEIVTSPFIKGPSKDWLKIVKTNEARSKINAFFKKQLKSENVKVGKALLEKWADSKNYQLSALIQDVDTEFLYKKYSIKSIKDLYACIGYGSIKPDVLINRFIKNYEDKNNIKKTTVLPAKSKHTEVKKESSKKEIIIQNEKTFLIKFARCCNPISGEPIVAYTSRGRGMSIHRENCPNLQYLEPERLVSAKWFHNAENNDVSVKVICYNNSDAIAKITATITSTKSNIVSINTNALSDKIEINIIINIGGVKDFEKISNKLKMLPFVLDVKRI